VRDFTVPAGWRAPRPPPPRSGPGRTSRRARCGAPRQLAQRRRHLPAQQRPVQRVVRDRPVQRLERGAAELDGTGPAGPVPVDDQVAGHRPEPGSGRRVPGQRLGMPPRREQRLLDDVLGAVQVSPREPYDVAEQRAGVLGDERADQLVVRRGGAFHITGTYARGRRFTGADAFRQEVAARPEVAAGAQPTTMRPTTYAAGSGEGHRERPGQQGGHALRRSDEPADRHAQQSGERAGRPRRRPPSRLPAPARPGRRPLPPASPARRPRDPRRVGERQCPRHSGRAERQRAGQHDVGPTSAHRAGDPERSGQDEYGDGGARGERLGQLVAGRESAELAQQADQDGSGQQPDQRGEQRLVGPREHAARRR
jgi:hypothetical protein